MLKITKRFRYVLLILLGVVVFIVLSVMAFVRFAPQFGQPPKGSLLSEISSSENYQDGIFVNLIDTKLNYSFSNTLGMIGEYIFAKNTAPEQALPTYFPVAPALSDADFRFTWFGHSAVLLEAGGKRIFLDPMLGPHASPVSFFGGRFKNDPVFDLENLGYLDAVVFSHDHYDHLDYFTIRRIKEKVGHFYVPLGLGSHLQAWGVSPGNITELDWWESATMDGVNLTATPARHFSGRGLGDSNKTLWASWVIEMMDKRIYFSGDSGYGPHFKQIGERFGTFDFAMMECGQYNERWEAIHMMPEQTVQAALDLGAAKVMPIHWGAFTLAPHAWYEPVERFMAAAKRLDLAYLTPPIGQAFSWQDEINDQWYRAVKK